MDCNEAKTKIDLFIDDLLDDAEKQRLIWHACSCPECKKALDDAIKVKEALAGLKELEPPAGLTASTIKKAKRHRAPIWAYASAAVAAVVALTFVFSPAVVPRANSTVDGEQKLLYSDTTCEEYEQDYSAAMIPETSAFGGMDAAEAPTENMIAVAPEVGTSGAGIAAYVDQTFVSEEDFVNAMRSEGAAYYYRPNTEALPEGAALVQIEVTECSVRWVYSFGEDSTQTLVFEWYRTLTADDIAGWNEMVMADSDDSALPFQQSGEIFWSMESRFDENAELVPTDGSAINAYWLQEGGAFHAELPPEFTEPDILKTCVMDTVPIE